MATDSNFKIKNGLSIGDTEVINSSGNWVNTSATIEGTSITGTSLDINGNADISGNITNATWNGDVIASAYLDADTAHLSGTQTFTGAKTFSSAITIGSSTVATPNAAADDFVIKGSGTAVGLTISQDSDAGTGTIFFGDSTSSTVAGFRYNHNTGDMAISAEDFINFTSDGLQIGGSTFLDSSSNLTNIGTISAAAITTTAADQDIDMDASASGQIRIDGNGYNAAIALGSSTMAIYHNSASRSLTLGTNETARITIGGAGGVNFNSNNLTSVGTISSGAITSTGSSQVADLTVTGNLTVQGTTVTLDTATLNVEDKNITLNYSTGDSSGSADGAGITIQDAVNSTTDATITWSQAGNNFNVSHGWNSLGYLQHSGVLYSRNNLLVLNSAGNGWNTWATRSNGQFNLNVGTISSTYFDASGTSIFKNGTNDVLRIQPQAAGSGVIAFVTNSAGSVYEPLIIDFETLDLRTSGTPKLSINSSGNATFAGTITATDLYLNDTNTRIHEGANNTVKVTTSTGYLEIGSANAAHAHIQTDRSSFYFNKRILVNEGVVSSYDEDLILRRAEASNTGQLVLGSGKFTGTEAGISSNLSTMIIGGMVGDAGYEQATGHFYIPGISPNAFSGLSRRGTVTITKNGTDLNGDYTNMFTSGGDFYAFSHAAGTTDTIVITLSDFGGLSYGQNYGIQFCHPTFRAKDIEIEVSTDGGTNWTSICDVTDYPHAVLHHYYSGGGTAVNTVRYTLTNFANTGMRINQVFGYDYSEPNQYYLEKYRDNSLYADSTWTDNYKAKFGTGGDLHIYHDGLNSYIDDAGTGNLRIRAGNLQLQRADGSQNYLAANTGAEVVLYYAGNPKLETTSAGISVTGTINSGAITANAGTGVNQFYSAQASSNADDWQISPISIRERGLNGNASTSSTYAPNLNFHWGSVASRSLTMLSDGNFVLGEWAATGTPNTTSSLSTLNTGGYQINATTVIDGSRNLTNIGTISSGRITTSGTGTAGAPTLDIINSSSSTFNHSIEAIAPNMTTGETNILVVGQASSTKNSGYIGYYYAGAGSNSNFVSIGHWGADHLFRVYGDGTVTVGTNRVLTVADEGSGNGLDADTVDTLHASSFLRSDASDSFSGKLTSTISAGSDALDLATSDGYASMRVIRNNKPSSDGMYIGYANQNSGMTRLFGGGATSGGIYITGSGVDDLKYSNQHPIIHTGNAATYIGYDQWYSTSTYIYDATNGTRYYWNLLGTIGASGSKGVIEYECKGDENYPSFVRGTIAFGGFNGGASFSVQHDQSTTDAFDVNVRVDTSRRIWIQVSGSAWSHYFRFRVYNNGNFTTNTSWSTGTTRYDPATTSVPPNSSNDIEAGQNLRATSSSVTGSIPSYSDRQFKVQNLKAWGTVDIDGTTASTSTTTGALTVGGGAGVAGDVFVGAGVRAAHIGINGTAGTGYPLYVQSGQRYLVGLNNTTADANYPWLVHDTSNSKAALIVHFNGIGDRLILEEDGNLSWSGTASGNGSGITNVNAAQLGGISSTSFARSDASTTYSNYANLQRFYSNTNIASTSGGQSSLECFSNGSGNDAFMTFHVGSDYAIYLGLDGGTNKLSVGGWSMGANSYEIYHAGNKPSLATLGFTGDSNANYITNNNQLTNGAGYQTASTSSLTNYLIKGGSWNASNMPGSRWGGFAANGGEVVFQQDNPNTSQMSVMVDGNFYAGENNGFWSLYSNNNYNLKVGMYSNSSGNLLFSSVGITTISGANYLRVAPSSGEATIRLDHAGATPGYIAHGGWGIGANKTGIGNGSTPALVVDHNNYRVGVGNGISSPSAPLHVYTTRNDGPSMIVQSSNPGSWAASVVIGNTTIDQTLVDANDRPMLVLDGNYPVLNLNHTETTNSNHGPTIQFTHEGYNTNRQWVIGTDGQGQRLDFGVAGGGYGSNTDKNPHNGISGYGGTTIMRLFPTGVLVGETGTYPNEITAPDGKLDVRGDSNFTGNMLKKTYNKAIALYSSGTASSGSAIGFQQITAEGWSGIFVDYNPYEGWGLYHDNPSNYFLVTAETSTGAIGSGFTVPNRDSGSSTAYTKHLLDQNNGNFTAGGSISAQGNVTAYSSDRRLKENFRPIESAIDKVKQLNGLYFDWNKVSEDAGFIPDLKENDVGLIAQDVEKVIPQAVAPAPFDIEVITTPNDPKDKNSGVTQEKVSISGENYLTVKYEKLVPLLVEAIKEQQTTIESLKNEISDLVKDINSLKGGN